MSETPTIVRSKCSGCETCVALCPEVFEKNEETGEIEARELPEYPEEALHEAITHCPEDCIEYP